MTNVSVKEVHEVSEIRVAIENGHANSGGIILLREQKTGSIGNPQLIIGYSFVKKNMDFMGMLHKQPGVTRSSESERKRLLGDLSSTKNIGVFTVTEDVVRQIMPEAFEHYVAENHLVKSSSRSLQVAAV